MFVFKVGRGFGAFRAGLRILVACSGGVDSVTLVDTLARLSRRHGFSIALAHVHHGGDSESRRQARDFVERLAGGLGLDYFERRADVGLKSEEALRDFRQRALTEMKLESASDVIALGHHADDLLETRLMRLIRGTGAQGLGAMRAKTKTVIRPLLDFSRLEILTYAREQKLEWIEDSSNAESEYFRNWMRNEWLPSLEEKRPGSRVALARSLDLLCEVVPVFPQTSPVQSRSNFHALSSPKKRALIAAMARDLGARDFGGSKIIEVLKRLDRLEVSRQKRAQFSVGGLDWSVTRDEITAGPRSETDAALRS